MRVDVGIDPCGQGQGLAPTVSNAISEIDVGADDHISPLTRKDDQNTEDRILTADI
jgi:hypothetical protein